MKPAPTGRELLVATAFVCVFIAVIALIANQVGSQANRERGERGVQVTATITDKRRQWVSSGGRGGSRVNAFTVMYFDSVETEYTTTELAEGVEITLPSGVNFGDFHSADILHVPRHVYQNAEEGDSVEIVFLPEEPEEAWLADSVTNYSVYDGYIFIAILVGIALLCLGIAFRLKPSL